MKAPNLPFPSTVAFAADTGVIPEATARYQRRLSHLRALFLDPEALERRIREENDPGIDFSCEPFHPNRSNAQSVPET